MPPGAKETATVDKFLNAIVRSGLINHADLQTLVKELPKDCKSDAKSLAGHLTKTGKLSTFQAQKLLKGAYSGLMLGPYEVMAPIGKGGMGSVYLARDTRIQKLLALKVLPPKKAKQNERMMIRFQRELDINKRVAHPHIAWTYEGGTIQGVYFMAMEFIPGKTLTRLVAERGPFSVAQVARIGVEIALGLHYAHTQGVVHRDLKPSNIMITPNGHAKILDLGLALVQGETGTIREVIGGQGYVVGSMDYIAPEQIKDAAHVDGRADVYSLGCTLFFALTGRPLFPGGDAYEKMKRHRKERPPPLRELNPAVPKEFAKIIHNMMEKKAEDRYTSMKEVREALFKWAVSEPELPMDQSTDRSFQEVIQALQTTDVPSEMVNETILDKGSDSVEDNETTGFFDRWRSMDATHRGYYLFGGGIILFWLIILVVLGLFLTMRSW